MNSGAKNYSVIIKESEGKLLPFLFEVPDEPDYGDVYFESQIGTSIPNPDGLYRERMDQWSAFIKNSQAKAIPFDNPDDVLALIAKDCKYCNGTGVYEIRFDNQIDCKHCNATGMNLKSGSTYPIPSGYQAEMKNQYFDSGEWRDCKHGIAYGMFHPSKLRQLATLTSNSVHTEACPTCGKISGEFCSDSFHLPVRPEDGTNVIKILDELNASIYKLRKTKSLTPQQVERVVEWMNEWNQLKGTAIPIRFKEDFLTS